MTRLTPVRWLILIASLAGLYAGIAVTAWSFGHLVPQQLHSVVLTAFTGGVIVAVVDSRSDRRDRLVLAKLDELLFRHVCWMEATARPVVAEVTGEIRRPSGVYRAAAPVPPGAIDRYDEGFVDGLAKRPGINARVIKMETRKS